MLCIVFFVVLLSVVVSSRPYFYTCKIMDRRNPGKIFASFISWATLAGILFLHADAFKIAPPEFADPVKNISVPAGSNIGFFCNVINLGGNRIVWAKQEEEKEVLLGINSLLITKNTRVSISVVPNSGEMTQSILYINSVEKDDDGHYKCIVNASPMISQVGTLEVRDVAQQEPEKVEKVRETPFTTVATSTTAETYFETSTVPPTTTTDFCPIPACEDPDRNVICIDLDNMWVTTRDKAQYLFSWFYGALPSVF